MTYGLERAVAPHQVTHTPTLLPGPGSCTVPTALPFSLPSCTVPKCLQGPFTRRSVVKLGDPAHQKRRALTRLMGGSFSVCEVGVPGHDAS